MSSNSILTKKHTIIISGNYLRKDFLTLFSGIKEDCKLFFIEFDDEKKEVNKYYKEYGKAIYWKGFSDAFSLLNQFKPDKVIFLNIESFNHVALLSAAKQLKIITFHLEHGLRLSKSFSALLKIESQRQGILRTFRNTKILISLLFFLNGFYKKTSIRSNLRYKQLMYTFFKLRNRYGISKTLQKLKSEDINPDFYITYSKAIFDFHKKRNQLSDEFKNYIEIGFPQFDDFHGIEEFDNPNEILFIDQPFVEQKLFGWDLDYKRRFVEELLIVTKNFKFNYKPHPTADKSFVKNFKNSRVKIVSDDVLKDTIAKSKIIIGFYSTLLVPLAAMEHTTLFCFENHPFPPKIKQSYYLCESRVACQINDLKELESNLNHVEKVHSQQLRHKNNFIKNWMYKFDGNSNQRLKSIIIG